MRAKSAAFPGVRKTPPFLAQVALPSSSRLPVSGADVR